MVWAFSAFGRAGVCACAFLALAINSHAWAQGADPAVANGAAWLEAQVQNDGSLLNEGNSIATPLQSRAEVTLALAVAATAPSSLVGTVSADIQTNTDYLVRRALALHAAQQNISSLISTLSASQNGDGGWSNAEGYSTNALDTAMAIAALCESSASSAVIGSGIAALQSLQLADGGFGLTNSDDLYVSLWSLRAFDACATRTSVAQPATALTAWVLAQRNGAGEFGDVELDAIGLVALIGRTADSTILTPYVNALHSSQAADGSWNEDPYLTALAIGALAAKSSAPPPPTTGGISGFVADSNGNPLVGATVQLIEAPQFSTNSAGDGSFNFSGVGPGTYTVRAQLLGYSVAQHTAIVSAGTIANVGTLTLTANPLTAALTGHVQDANKVAIPSALVTAGSAFVATDVSGNYSLTGLPAGATTITVSANGYQSATAAATFVAGQTYVFSPTLYTSAPPATSVTGKVVDAQSSAPIFGAQIQLGAQSTTTLADGTFTLTGIASGSFTMSVMASGYLGANVTGVLSSGANTLGTIPLSPAPATSSLTGTVTSSTSGTPIIGAAVVIQGTALTTTTDSAGHYTIASISQTTFVVSVSAAGYLTQQTSVQLNSPGAATLNVALVPATSSSVSFTSITTSASQYGPDDGLDVAIQAANAGTAAVDLIVQGDILDSNGNVVVTLLANPVGSPGAVVNQPINLAASSSTSVALAYHLQHEPAGNYSVHVRGFSTVGQVLAEGSVGFSVTAIAVVGGVVDADPPLLAAGTNTPVHVTATLGDLGNLSIPAGNAKLKVTLDSVDDNYNPADQGHLKLRATDPLLQTSGTAFADPDGSIYTYSQITNAIVKTTPTGQVSVAVDLKQYGIAYLRDLARDANGTWWLALGASRVANITAQGIYSEFNLQTTSVFSLTLDSAGNQFYLDSDHIVRRDPQGIESTIWSGGLAYPVGLATEPDGSFVVTNSYYGNGFLVRMAADGKLTPFTGGLNYPKGIARGPDGNYYVADAGQKAIIQITPAGTKSIYAAGLNSPYGVVFNSKGELFVSDQGADAILKINSDGSNSVLTHSFMSSANAIAYGPDSSLYVTQANGVVKRTDPQGNVTDLATGISNAYGLVIDANSVAYVTSYDSGRIERVSTQGTQDFATGLTGPGGIAIDAAHQYLAVAENAADRLRWYDLSGSELGRVASAVRAPVAGAKDASGNIYVANDNFISAFAGGAARIYSTNIFARALAYNPVAARIEALAGGNVLAIASNGTTTVAGTPPAGAGGLAIDDLGREVVSGPDRTNLYRADGTGSFSLLASLPAGESITALTSSTTGTVYFGTNQYHVYRLGDDASLQLIATWYFDIRSLAVGLDGTLAIVDTSGDTAFVNLATGEIRISAQTPCAYCSIVRDGSGDLVLLDQGQWQLYVYNPSGQLLSTPAGFSQPSALVWTGTEFRFWDQRGKLFSWTPGNYPVRMRPDASGMQGNMTWANGSLYALSGSYPGALYKWDSSGMNVWTMLPIVANLIATRPDGNLAVSDGNRLLVIDANAHIVSDLSGVVHPAGLAVDAQDRLYVASDSEGVVVRLDTANPVPVTFAKANWVTGVAVKPDGSLYATGLNYLYNIDTQGNVTTVANVGDVGGVAATAQGDAIAINSGYSVIDRWDGTSLSGFAAGLWGATTVRAAPDGSLYLSNDYNGALTHYHDGGISIVNAPIFNAHSIAIAADGTVFYGGNSYTGIFAEVRPDGTSTTLNLPQLLENANVTGLVSLGQNRLGMVTQGQTLASGVYSGSVYDIAITPPSALPPAGTVVYQSSQALPSIAPLDPAVGIDFGSWTPTLPGDYRLEVTHSQATGSTVNHLHVGPSAQGTLTSSLTTVPPGNAQVPVTLNVTGAAFESLAKIDASQIRPVATVPSPGSFAVDAAGNAYYGDGNGLNRVATPGSPTLLVAGYNSIATIAADPQNRILFIGYNTTALEYELVRFDPVASTTTILYTSPNTSPILGLAVNAVGDAYISIGSNLTRVRPDGSNSIVLDTGVYGSQTLSFDQAGDLFIETSNQTASARLINQLKPDMTLHGVFGSANGTSTPYFLNDEWGDHGVAGGCGHNLFLSPSSWTAIGPGSEEHLLAQVFADSGKAGLVFDGALFGLTDMDAVITDPSHQHVYVWDDEDYLITQIPIMCGAISVEAHVIAKSGQKLVNLSHPADATISLVDGRTDYVFSLQNVPITGVQVHLDAPLTGLSLGENVPVLDSAYLLFKNTFTNQDFKLPLTVPQVQVANAVQLNIGTDQPQYAANATAQINTLVVNPAGQGTISGSVQVDVLDASNALVAHVATQAVSLSPTGQTSVPGAFTIGTIVPGTYIARATMTNAGVTLAQSTTTFIVNADQGSGEITSQLAVDKLSYNPTDQAQLISHVSDVSANAIVSNLTLQVKVSDVANNVLFAQSYPIVQILPQQTLAFTSEYSFQNLDPGTYEVQQRVTDATNTVLSSASTSLVVIPNTAQALNAQLSIAPLPARTDQALTCQANLQNTATAAAPGLALRLAILNLASSSVTTLTQATTDLAGGAQWQTSANMPPRQLPQGDYACALQLQTGGAWQTLGYTSFTMHAVVDLQTALSAPITDLAPNQIRFFRLQVKNVGPDTTSDSNFTITLPPQLQWVEFAQPAPTCTVAGVQVTCALPALPVSSGVDLCFAARAGNAPTIPLTTQATAVINAGTTIDPQPGNNTANMTTNLVADLLYANGFDSYPCSFAIY